MAENSAGIYYPTNSDNANLQQAFQDFSESVSDKLNILQIVTAETSTLVTTAANNTWVESGLSATITPKFSTSKIIVMVSLPYTSKLYWNNPSGIGSAGASFRITRNGTAVSSFVSSMGGVRNGVVGSGIAIYDSPSQSYIDSPNTVTAVTYKVSGKINYVTSGFLWMNFGALSEVKSSITLMEVAANAVNN